MGLLTANRSRTPAVALILFEHPWATLVLMAAGDGLRRTGRAAGDHRAVHLDPVPGRLRGLWTFAGPGARSGFFPRSDDRGHDPAAGLARAEPTPRWIIVAAEPITDVDTTAADMLTDLDEGLNAGGTSLVFAEVKDPVRRKIERYQLTRTIDPQHFFPTLEAAVEAFRAETGARWEAPTVPTTGTL